MSVCMGGSAPQNCPWVPWPHRRGEMSAENGHTLAEDVEFVHISGALTDSEDKWIDGHLVAALRDGFAALEAQLRDKTAECERLKSDLLLAEFGDPSVIAVFDDEGEGFTMRDGTHHDAAHQPEETP